MPWNEQSQALALHGVTGLIQKDQLIEVYLTLDDGTPVLVFTIEGDGSYVDQGINTPIGSVTIGSKVIGGGGEATAHPFDLTFPIHTDIFSVHLHALSGNGDRPRSHQ